ncbi:M23 family metallopeptidase [uncultured Citricoccus sp.]|nr:M23 family metallopeptidase [uncultured Citricoccus sp.]
MSPHLPRPRRAVRSITPCPMAVPAAAVAALALLAPSAAEAGPGGPGDWSAPSPARGASAVLRPFDPPAAPWSSGHRGVDWASPDGGVLAPGAGTIRFAGPVAGRSVVTVAHPDGMLSSLEPVDLAPGLAVGDRIGAGEPVGSVQGGVGHCPVECVHWGVRIPDGWTVQGATWDRYVDPLVLLGLSGPSVLWPVTGGPPVS